ncbi:MAG: arsenite methyltransferase [Moorellaceae bacterium]
MNETLKQAVKEKYALAARKAQAGQPGSCCTSGGCFGSCHYSPEETVSLPQELIQASLGCGNPTMLADLKEGEVVLDLGSGAGLDTLLSARRVGPRGKVYGLDMTEEMLALAEEYRRRSGLTNVQFLQGDIENIPLPDNHVDVIISNCVINLAADKARALSEAFRVLKPGGRLAVSDMVWRQEVPARLRANVGLWTECVAGALTVEEYRRLLQETGFTGIEIDIIRGMDQSDQGLLDLWEGAVKQETAELVPYMKSLASAFIRAYKPANQG